ncbi:MAG: type II secretion system protein [Thermodesulfobacteriota bacterium]
MMSTWKNQQGFSLVELSVVMAILTVLSGIAMVYFNDLMKTSRDSVVYSNADHLMKIITNNILDKRSVDYQATRSTGSTIQIGVAEEDGTPRSPIHSLSPGVRIVFMPGFNNMSYRGTNPSSFVAYLYHANGSESPFDPTGNNRRGVQLFIDEDTRVYEYIMF